MVVKAGQVLLVVSLQHGFMELVTRGAPEILWVFVNCTILLSHGIQVALLFPQDEILLSLAKGRVVAIPEPSE